MSDSRRSSPAPWITAAVAGAVFVALLVVYDTVLIPYRNDHTAAQLTATEKEAINAASTETVNLLSYDRKTFDTDYARAVAGTTGALKTQVLARKATTEKTLISGKFDLDAKVTHEALVGPGQSRTTSDGFVVLVTVNGFKSTQPQVPTQQNLQVTVVRSGGKWRIDDVQNVGIS